MILNISELVKKNIEQKDFNIVFNEAVLFRDDYKIEFVSPAKISGTIFYNGKTFNLKGNIKALIKLQCSRCLNFFNYDLTANFDENFSKENIDDFYPVLDDHIDLTDMVIDNIILSLPIKPLCSENCKGIRSSQDKNNDIDPRFAVLKNFFNGNQGGVNDGKSSK